MSYFSSTFRAYRRYLHENTNMLGDGHRFLGVVIARKAVKQSEIPIMIRKRKAGQSSYNLKKVYLVIADLIFLKFTISHMNEPFRLFGVVGGIMFLFGLIPTIYTNTELIYKIINNWMLINKSISWTLYLKMTFLCNVMLGFFNSWVRSKNEVFKN